MNEGRAPGPETPRRDGAAVPDPAHAERARDVPTRSAGRGPRPRWLTLGRELATGVEPSGPAAAGKRESYETMAAPGRDQRVRAGRAGTSQGSATRGQGCGRIVGRCPWIGPRSPTRSGGRAAEWEGRTLPRLARTRSTRPHSGEQIVGASTPEQLVGGSDIPLVWPYKGPLP